MPSGDVAHKHDEQRQPWRKLSEVHSPSAAGLSLQTEPKMVA
jgi:hypothetical protein